MECSMSSPLSAAPSFSVVFPGNSSRRFSSLNFRQLVGFHHARCQKMFVPGFGEASPEAKAAANLHHFFTFVAIKIVLAQLQSYNREAYEELMEFVSHNSLNDGDQFCRRLMRESPRHKGLGESYNLEQIEYRIPKPDLSGVFVTSHCFPPPIDINKLSVEIKFVHL